MDDAPYDARQPESVAAVLKVFAILQALSERSDTGISELSVRLAMPKATVYRFLQTMKTLGYVRQEVDSERYGLSMKVFEIGAKALPYHELVDIAQTPMQNLSEATGESVQLGLLIDSAIICVHRVDSRRTLGIHSRVGYRAPLHCTAIGKVLLAWERPERRDRILEGYEFTRFRDQTIASRAAFDAELQRTLAQGFGQDREEFDDHIRCVGIPVFDRNNHVVAGLSVSFPTFRYDTETEQQLVSSLRAASREISAQLGCTAFPLASPESALRL